jgi:hypothetical protein
VDGGCPSSDKAQAPWGKEVRRFFCDIHKTKKNRERYRITYTTDGITYKHVDSFKLRFQQKQAIWCSWTPYHYSIPTV